MKVNSLISALVTFLFIVTSCSPKKEVIVEFTGKPQVINMNQIVNEIKNYKGLGDTVLFEDKRFNNKYKYVLSPKNDASSVRYDIYKTGTVRIGADIPFNEDLAIQALKRKNLTYPDFEKAVSIIIKGNSQLNIDPTITINEYFEFVKEEALKTGAKDTIVKEIFNNIKSIATQKLKSSKDVFKLEYLIKHINYQLSVDKEKLLNEEGLFNTKNLNGQEVLIIAVTYRHKNLDAVDNIEFALKAAERALELKIELANGKLNLNKIVKYMLVYAPVNNSTSKVVVLFEPNNIPILNAFVLNTPSRENLFLKSF